MVVEAEKCTNCKACVVACQQRNETGYGRARNWIRSAPDGSFPSGYSHQPGSCMQCESPLCVEACPTGATSRDADGVVRINQRTCIGCGSCVKACPYGARHKDPVYGIADKCDYCSATLGQGLAPACVLACAARVRTFGDADDPDGPVARLLAGRAVTRIEPPEPPNRAVPPMKPTQVYLGRTGPVDWPRRTGLPGPVAAMVPVAASIRWLGSLSLLGCIGVLLKQLVLPSDPGPSEPGPGDRAAPPDAGDKEVSS
jgi:Fe-S-cluster-containing dehydrogenase component